MSALHISLGFASGRLQALNIWALACDLSEILPGEPLKFVQLQK